MTSPRLQRLFDTRRPLDQVTGANVIRPEAWTKGANPPRVLVRAPKIETSFDEDHAERIAK